MIANVLLVSVLLVLVNGAQINSHEKYDGEVVFLGASITEYWMSEGRSVWDEYYAGKGAVNVGVAGDKTQQTIDRINGGMINNYKARVAVLDIGSNDLGDGWGEDYVVDQIGKLLILLKEKLPGVKIIISHLMPRADRGNEIDQRCRNVNDKIRKYEDGSTVFAVNLDNQLATGIGQLRWDLYWDDKLHINNKGYRVWAETMAPVFNSVYGK